MNRLAILCILGSILKTAFCLPPPRNGFNNAYNPSPMSQNQNPYMQNAFNEVKLAKNSITNPFMPNGLTNASPILANEFNAFNNDLLANSASLAVSGMNVPSPAFSNIEVSPYISDVVPSLQYGDVSMTGDLPIGGTIKVSGCFPVYGMIAVDGSVPSSGSAVVADSIGNQVIDVVNKCANQYFS